MTHKKFLFSLKINTFFFEKNFSSFIKTIIHSLKMDDFMFHYCTACSHLFYVYVNLFSLNVNVIVNQCKKKKKN